MFFVLEKFFLKKLEFVLIALFTILLSATGFPNKVYLGTAQGEFEKQFRNHNTSFKNASKRNDTTLTKYVWDLKLKHNVTLH